MRATKAFLNKIRQAAKEVESQLKTARKEAGNAEGLTEVVAEVETGRFGEKFQNT